MKVALFVTCVVDAVRPDAGVATVRALRTAGHEVVFPLDQTCCGQPAWNSGFAADAGRVATATLEALETSLAEGAEAVVVPAGSCATMIRVFWPELFEGLGDHAMVARARAVAGKTFEFSEFLSAQSSAALTAPAVASKASAEAGPVAYHHSCHMLRELDIEAAPRELLAGAGVAVADWPDAYRCCGFGGLFSVKLPETSVAMADEKLGSIPDGVDTIVGCDASCLMHLQSRIDHRGLPLRTVHLAELLAGPNTDPSLGALS